MGTDIENPKINSKDLDSADQKVCVLVVSCQFPDGKEKIFATELSAPLPPEVYENMDGQIDIEVAGHTIHLSNSLGWHEGDDDGLMIFRELIYCPETLERFEEDKNWSEWKRIKH